MEEAETTSCRLPATLCGCTVRRELSPRLTYLAAGPGGRPLVLKRLDSDCLLEGELHPLIHDRLARVRELAHMGVANLLGVQRDGEAAFLVWDFVQGETLEQYLQHDRPEAVRLRTIARTLLSSIESLHALGIVHGAIHERNILIRPDGSLCLTHVSPLLYHDTQVDVDAAARILSFMGLDLDGHAVSVRELAERFTRHPAAPASLGPLDDARRAARPRWLAIGGAVLVSLLGAALAWGLWSYAHRVSDPTPIQEARP